jgi:hypothetical protein
LEHDTNDVLADVMHIALDGREQHLADRTCLCKALLCLFLLHERQQIGDRLLHDAGRFDHLGEEHLSRAEQVANKIHPGHQGAFDDM